MRTKEEINKYFDDISKIKLDDIKLASELLGDNTLHHSVFTIAFRVKFDDFEYHIKNDNYHDVYSSEVFQIISTLNSKENICTLKKGTEVFRARIIENIQDLFNEKNGIKFENGILHGYDNINSKEPPIGFASGGRANSQFSSYFYCSENGNTASSEVKPYINDYISLASFKINHSLKLINLSSKQLNNTLTDESIYKYMIATCFSKPIKNAKDYKVTQFIGDEIRKLGVDGICYTSFFTGYKNYVIFNCSSNNLRFLNSRVIRLHSQKLNFADLSLEDILSTTCNDDISPDDILKEKLFILSNMQNNRDREFILENIKTFSDGEKQDSNT